MELKDKIIKIISTLNWNSAKFADFIEVKRPTISHILTGRNKPSLDIIQRIIEKFPELGFDWISDNQILREEILLNIQKYKYDNYSLFDSPEFDNPNNTTSNNKISNSQATKKIESVKAFFDDGRFSNLNNAEIITSDISTITIFFEDGTYKNFTSEK